ncbi:heme-binding protein [uncultured Rhodoblastus sp.]|uniref:GlcG/HbpS family heme-binding protein n=1 Tax=uncultured Rhodoblastus sp. TaxID=543037 RepID=UPI0025F6B448|nr:heme-binding protein [uncultured Rhodoblastus sp.]
MKNFSTSVLWFLGCAGVALAQGAPAPAGAPQNPPPPPARGPGLDLALEAAQTALEAARVGEQKVAVSIIDSAGVLKAVLVSDGTGPRAVQNSNFKAQAALAFKEPSGQLAEEVKTNKELADKIAANPNYLARAGAVLIKVNDEVIGAIGVGGARGSDKDEAYAKAGLEKIQARVK